MRPGTPLGFSMPETRAEHCNSPCNHRVGVPPGPDTTKPHTQSQVWPLDWVQDFYRSGGDITSPTPGGHLEHAASSASLGDLLLMFARGRRRLRR